MVGHIQLIFRWLLDAAENRVGAVEFAQLMRYGRLSAGHREHNSEKKDTQDIGQEAYLYKRFYCIVDARPEHNRSCDLTTGSCPSRDSHEYRTGPYSAGSDDGSGGDQT